MHLIGRLAPVCDPKAQLTAANGALGPGADPGKPPPTKNAKALGHSCPMNNTESVRLVTRRACLINSPRL